MVPFSAYNAPLLRGGDALASEGMEEPAVRMGRPKKRYSARRKESRKEACCGPAGDIGVRDKLTLDYEIKS
jgi:hypothetical protein